MKDLNHFEWLIGQWEGVHGQGVYHEQWEKMNDGELKGRAYMIMRGEIKNVEILRLHSDEKEIYYTADVSHNPKPVSFKLTYSSETTSIFENLQHDFPKKITYEKRDNDSLLAIIEGLKNDKIRRVEFYLKKIDY